MCFGRSLRKAKDLFEFVSRLDGPKSLSNMLLVGKHGATLRNKAANRIMGNRQSYRLQKGNGSQRPFKYH